MHKRYIFGPVSTSNLLNENGSTVFNLKHSPLIYSSDNISKNLLLLFASKEVNYFLTRYHQNNVKKINLSTASWQSMLII